LQLEAKSKQFTTTSLITTTAAWLKLHQSANMAIHYCIANMAIHSSAPLQEKNRVLLDQIPELATDQTENLEISYSH
jgi:hypothetical protein